MLTEDTIVPSTEEPIPVATPEFQEQGVEDFPEAGPDPFVAAEEDIMSDSSGIEMPEEEGVGGEVSILQDTGDEVISMPEPIEPEMPPVKSNRAKEDAYYAVQELESQNPEGDYNSAHNDLVSTGKSELVERAEDQAKESDLESDQEAIESIISDESINPLLRQSMLKTYIQTGYHPQSLKQRYINKIAIPEENARLYAIAAQEQTFEMIRERSNNQSARVRHADMDSISGGDVGFWGGLGAGFDLKLDQAFETMGLFGVTKEDVERGMAKVASISNKSTLGTVGAALGQVGGIVVPAVPFALLGGLPAIGAMAFIGGVVQGTSKYSELGVSNVEQEDRLLASIGSAALTTADFALPIFRAVTVLRAMILNGAGNVAIGELDVGLQNHILEAYPELKQPQFDLTTISVNAMMGIAIGGIAGRIKEAPAELPEMGVPQNSVYDSMKVGDPNKAAKDASNTILNDTPDSKNAHVKNGGRTMGTIIHDWFLPRVIGHRLDKQGKVIDENSILIAKEISDNKKDLDSDKDVLPPDVQIRVEEDFHILDTTFRNLFEVFRWDPNVTNVTQRYKDIASVVKISENGAGPKYHHSASKMSVTDEVSYGQMIFTPRRSQTWKADADGEASPQARKALKEKQAQIDASSSKDDGELGLLKKDGGYVIAWNWRKEYEPLSVGILGVQPIKILGMDVSAIARSKVGTWLIPTGIHKKLEQGALRGVEREARLATRFQVELDRAVGNLKHKNEFAKMIIDAEEGAFDNFSLREIQAREPYLKLEEQTALWEAWAKWRRILDYQWNFANRQDRNAKYRDGMRGVYSAGEGKPMGIASETISPADLTRLNEGKKYIWDYEANTKILFDKKKFEAEGRTVVRMGEPIGGKGDTFEFGLLSDKVRLHHLPEITLPKLAGYAPRHTKENFFIDMHPKQSAINGEVIIDQKILRDKLSTTKAAARTQLEGDQMKAQLEKDNPDMVVTVRPERMDKIEQMADDMRVRADMTEEAKRRGQRLVSIDGYARLEDRLVSHRKAIDTLVKTEAFKHWELAFRNSFNKSYSDLFEGKDFPSSRQDIQLGLVNATKENKIRFQDALRHYDYFAMMKQMETASDHVWKDIFHTVADLIENVLPNKVARGPADIARRIGGKGNLVVKIPKQVVSAAFIHLNPIRQHMIQPAQLREMYFVNPATFLDNVANTTAIRAALIGQSSTMKAHGGLFTALSKKGVRMDEKEFNEVIEAIQNSGMLDSISRNTLVEGMLQNSKAQLVENGWDTFARIATNSVMNPISKVRSVGFDYAEMTNRIGMYLQARSMWKKQNPKGNWKTLENQEIIAAEGLKLSGAMNRAGSLPYQHGVLSVFMQFAAVNHKLTLNLLQDTATIMSRQDRIRLAAVRFAMYGGKYGLPAAGFVAYSYGELATEPFIQDPEMKMLFERGIIDYVVNRQIAPMLDDEGTYSDILVSKGLTPYSEDFLPMFTFIHESYKLIDGKGNTNPRYPALGLYSSFSKTLDEMASWTNKKDIGPTETFRRTMMEAAEMASVFRNFSKGRLQMGMRKQMSSRGQDLGEHVSYTEALYKMGFGGQTGKETDMFEAIGNAVEDAKGKKEMAEDIMGMLANVENTLGTRGFEEKISNLNSYFTLIDYSDAEKLEVMDMVLKLDRRRQTDTKSSLLYKLWKYRSDTTNEEFQKIITTLRGSRNPKTIKWLKSFDDRDNIL